MSDPALDSLENGKPSQQRLCNRHAALWVAGSYKLPSYILPGPAMWRRRDRILHVARSLVICCRR